MSEHSKLFNIMVSPELLARFDYAVSLQGLNRSELMRTMMNTYADSIGIKTIKDVK